MSKICQNCNSEIPEDAEFCFKCGTEVNSQNEVVNVDNESPNEITVSNNTKFCSNCGAEISINAVACPKCGAGVSRNNQSQQQANTKKFCSNCGSEVNINAVVCTKCGASITGNAGISGEKSVGLSALLSIIFPGLGHFYIGLNHKGLIFLIVYIISIPLIFLIIGIVLAIAIWIWALVDVIKSTEALNAGEQVEDKLF